jgi:nitroreductase
MALLQSRRSIRNYQPGPLDPALVGKLAESVRHVPSGGNDHRLGVTFIQDGAQLSALRERILAYYVGMLRLVRVPPLRFLAWLTGNHKVRAALGDPGFVDKIARMVERIRGGRDLIFYGAPLVALFHTRRQLPTPAEDAVIAAHQMCLAAHTLGLGSCYVSLSQQVFAADPALRRQAGLTDADRVHIVLVIGEPSQVYRRGAWRPPK